GVPLCDSRAPPSETVVLQPQLRNPSEKRPAPLQTQGLELPRIADAREFRPQSGLPRLKPRVVTSEEDPADRLPRRDDMLPLETTSHAPRIGRCFKQANHALATGTTLPTTTACPSGGLRRQPGTRRCPGSTGVTPERSHR